MSALRLLRLSHLMVVWLAVLQRLLRAYNTWLNGGAVDGVVGISVYDLDAARKACLFRTTSLGRLLGPRWARLRCSMALRRAAALDGGHRMFEVVCARGAQRRHAIGRTIADARAACSAPPPRYRVATVAPCVDVTPVYNRFAGSIDAARLHPCELLAVAYIDGIVPVAALMRTLRCAGVTLAVLTLETMTFRRFAHDEEIREEP